MNEKFNSQVCTTKIQSQRLLDLGLKPETADMVYTNASLPFNKDEFHIICKEYSQLNREVNYEISPFIFIPAWSLHRLLCLYGQDYTIKEVYNDAEECYGMLISAIEIAIENDEFNEKYLDR